MEQPEFLRRQVDVLAADTHAAACWIDVQTVHLHRAIAGGGRFGLQLRSARTAQQRAHPRHQLANAERLRQVIIGAALEAKHLIALLTASREHQDWHVLVGSLAPDRATDRDAIDAREHQVENDEVERARVGADERGLAVAHGLGLETLEAEVEHDQVTNMRIVFDDQYAGHGCSPRLSGEDLQSFIDTMRGCAHRPCRHSFFTPGPGPAVMIPSDRARRQLR